MYLEHKRQHIHVIPQEEIVSKQYCACPQSSTAIPAEWAVYMWLGTSAATIT
jgi:hypothetical protein